MYAAKVADLNSLLTLKIPIFLWRNSCFSLINVTSYTVFLWSPFVQYLFGVVNISVAFCARHGSFVNSILFIPIHLSNCRLFGSYMLLTCCLYFLTLSPLHMLLLGKSTFTHTHIVARSHFGGLLEWKKMSSDKWVMAPLYNCWVISQWTYLSAEKRSTLYLTDPVTVCISPPQAKWETAGLILSLISMFRTVPWSWTFPFLCIYLR